MRNYVALCALAGLVQACSEPAATPVPEEVTLGDYTAGGTEPFWGVEIKGEEISFSTPEETNNFTLPVARMKKTQNGWTVQGFSDLHNVNLYIETGKQCSDGMSDRVYADTVKVEASNSGTMTGCGGDILEGGDSAP